VANKNLEETILRIVEQHRVTDQKQMLEALKKEEILVNQSTLSRRLKKLNIRKLSGVYQFVRGYDPGSSDTFVYLANGVTAVPPNMLLIKTLPGHASAVSYHFEKLEVEGVAGTVAGDDTVIVAISPPERLQPILDYVVGLFDL
jgi:transcriptional regulator of arginine metabolism